MDFAVFVSIINILEGGKMKKIIAILLLVLVLAGCETTQGIGRDIERLGEKTQEVLDPQ